MSVLSYESIKKLCEDENVKLVDPFDYNNIKGASYDLTIGDWYYLYKKGRKKIVEMIHRLKNDDKIIIPPREVCVVLSKETLNLPKDLSAAIYLRNALIKKGLFMPSQSPIDPYHKTKVFSILYNLSNKDSRLKKGEAFVSVIFTKLDSETEKQYEGKFKNLNKLTALLDEPIVSNLKEMQDDLERWRNRFERSIPTILTIITIVLAILTFIVSSFILKNIFP